MANTQRKITSDWMSADESANRLELASTDQPGLVAIRDTYEPDRQVYATTRQVSELVRAADRGSFQKILGSSAR